MDREKPESFVARVPFSTVLASVVGLWTAYLVLMTLRAELLDMQFTQEMFGLRVLTSFLGVLITLALWLVLRVFDARPLWLKITAALFLAVPAALLSAQANRIVFSEMQAALDERVLEEFADSRGIPAEQIDGSLIADLTKFVSVGAREQIIETAISRYFMMLTWCALYLALLTGEKARAAERREGAYRRAAKAAELRSLRYQVNPHFLFNTLNSLSALVLTDKKDAAERMIHLISRFYRRSLADDPTSDVTLAEEIALQKLYLDIEAVRFPSRLVADYNISPELQDCLIPGMILQPLVENSVKHAVAPSSGQVTITLAAREEYGRLVVSVSDNGNGAESGDTARPGFGIGLNNVRERIEARFGDEATIASGPIPEGYATYIRLPLLRADQHKEAAE